MAKPLETSLKTKSEYFNKADRVTRLANEGCQCCDELVTGGPNYECLKSCQRPLKSGQPLPIYQTVTMMRSTDTTWKWFIKAHKRLRKASYCEGSTILGGQIHVSTNGGFHLSTETILPPGCRHPLWHCR